jgi:hypothetical protein
MNGNQSTSLGDLFDQTEQAGRVPTGQPAGQPAGPVVAQPMPPSSLGDLFDQVSAREQQQQQQQQIDQQPVKQQPGYLSRAYETGPVAPVVQTGADIMHDRWNKILQASEDLRSGNAERAVHTAVSMLPFADPKSPEYKVIQKIAHAPVDEAIATYNAYRAKQPGEVATHAAQAALPPLAPAISAAREDIAKGKWAALAGDVSGALTNVAALLWGAKGEAVTPEEAAEAANIPTVKPTVLRPTTAPVAGEAIPVRAGGTTEPSSWLTKTAEHIANQDDLQRFNVSKTQPGARTALGNIANDATDRTLGVLAPDYYTSRVPTPVTTFSEGATRLQDAAQDVFKTLDKQPKIDGMSFSDAQRLERSGWRNADSDAIQKARTLQQQFMDQSGLPAKDLERAKGLWHRSMAFEDIDTKLTGPSVIKATDPKFLTAGQPDPGYIQPKALADTLVQLNNKGTFDEAGLSAIDRQNLQDLSTILRKAEVSGDRLNNILRFVVRKGVGTAIGGVAGGPVGASLGFAGELTGEWLTGKTLARIMTNSEAVNALTSGLKAGASDVAISDKIIASLRRSALGGVIASGPTHFYDVTSGKAVPVNAAPTVQ